MEAEEVDADVEPPFTEVRVVGHSPLPQTGGLEIVTHSGRVVRVAGEVDVDQLRAVLEVVEGC